MSDFGENKDESELKNKIQEANQLPWLFIDDLGAGDMLLVKVRGLDLEMKILDPDNRVVVIARGVAGSLERPKFATVTGSIINPGNREGEERHYKAGGIAVGLSLLLKLTGDDFYTVFQPTVEVYVNGKKVLPDLSKVPKRES